MGQDLKQTLKWGDQVIIHDLFRLKNEIADLLPPDYDVWKQRLHINETKEDVLLTILQLLRYVELDNFIDVPELFGVLEGDVFGYYFEWVSQVYFLAENRSKEAETGFFTDKYYVQLRKMVIDRELPLDALFPDDDHFSDVIERFWKAAMPEERYLAKDTTWKYFCKLLFKLYPQQT
jgi:formylmethanofuran dehydrogenase subunit E-like metal-binding protein